MSSVDLSRPSLRLQPSRRMVLQVFGALLTTGAAGGILAACGAAPARSTASLAAPTTSSQAAATGSTATATASGTQPVATVPAQRVAGKSGTLIRWQNRNDDVFRQGAVQLFESDFLQKHPGIR